jgi:hypothetical protein
MNCYSSREISFSWLPRIKAVLKFQIALLGCDIMQSSKYISVSEKHAASTLRVEECNSDALKVKPTCLFKAHVSIHKTAHTIQYTTVWTLTIMKTSCHHYLYITVCQVMVIHMYFWTFTVLSELNHATAYVCLRTGGPDDKPYSIMLHFIQDVQERNYVLWRGPII